MSMYKKRRQRDYSDIIVQCIIVIMLLAVAIPIAIANFHSQKNDIEGKVSELGGTLVEEHQISAFESDPFKWYEHGKNVEIWEFKYKDRNNIQHTGWVKFSFSTEWKLDQ
jgi:hypothetical protein